MTDKEITDLTADTSPATSVIIFGTDPSGTVDKKISLASLPVSTLQAAADTAARAAAEATAAADATAKVAAHVSATDPHADRAYADSLFAANDALLYKGVIDCSSNPNYPAASQGHLYKVSVAGKIGGASGPNVEVGDSLLCVTDGIAGTHASVGANWDIIQVNIDGAVTGPASSTSGNVPTFNGSTGKVVQDSGTALSSLAPLASPTFTGHPVGVTESAGDNSTRLASTAYVDAVVSDTAYDATSWNSVTGIAPSKNAVRDKFESLLTPDATAPIVVDVVTDPTKFRYYLQDVLNRRLFSGTPTSALTSSSTATSLLTASYSMPANTLVVGDTVEITATGITLSNTGSDQTATLRVKWATANLWTTGAITLPNAAVAYPWTVTVTMRLGSASSGTFDPMGTSVFGAAGGGTPVSTRVAQGTSTVYVPSGAGSAIDLTMQHNTTSASMSSLCLGFTIKRVPA